MLNFLEGWFMDAQVIQALAAGSVAGLGTVVGMIAPFFNRLRRAEALVADVAKLQGMVDTVVAERTQDRADFDRHADNVSQALAGLGAKIGEVAEGVAYLRGQSDGSKQSRSLDYNKATRRKV